MPQQAGHTENEYAILFQQGEEEALSFFYISLHPALSHFAGQYLHNRQLAEEIASDAFVKTWHMHHKLSSYAGIRAYLYKTVQRDCCRVMKKEKKITALLNKLSNDDSMEETPFDRLVRSELYRLLHESLKELSAGSRRVLIMHYLEGKSTGEIAEQLRLSPSTIRTQRNRGLEALRKKLLRPMLILFYLTVKFFLPFM